MSIRVPVCRTVTLILATFALLSAAWAKDFPLAVIFNSTPPPLGIYAGGPVYKEDRRAGTIAELVDSQFTEILVWSVHVDENHGLDLNMEFPLVKDGLYVGNATHPGFPGDLERLRAGGKRRITLSIGAAGSPAFSRIRNLIQSEGTGANSTLHRNFSSLKKALPAVTTIDFNDEVTYDADSMTKFAVLLADLGFKVSLCPYDVRYRSVWQEVARRVNEQRPGTIQSINLQCYGGGRSNNPSTWTFPGIPVYPGIWAKGKDASGKDQGEETTTSATQKYADWKKSSQTSGGFVWLYDEIRGKAGTFADAIVKGLQGNTVKAELKRGIPYTAEPDPKSGNGRRRP
jgi:hypothetical protein